tara:strand:- start:13356 stop:13898 length:543 start_codon:yes stop_codon:yes gene_type:complete
MMDDELKKICRKFKDRTRVGFSSKEFEDANEGDDTVSNNINRSVIEKIKENIECRCVGDGYVIPGTVKLISRSLITFPHEALQLHYTMNVDYEYTLCNPNPGVILKCKVVTKNKIGILARLENPKSPLVILVPEDLCNTPEKQEILESANKDDIISILVVGKKFEQNDKKITVIAEISTD